MKSKIVLLVGASGSGKDFALKYITKNYTEFEPIVSYTTRPIREGEVNGVDYNFVSEDKFAECEDYGDIFEHRKYDTVLNGEKATWFYGSPWLDVEIDDGIKYIGVVTLDGVKAYKEYYGEDVVEAIYIHSDDKVRKENAIARGTFCEKEWVRRLEADSVDFNEDLVTYWCDYFIENNGGKEFEDTLDEIIYILGR